ncbi:hypothetical protein TPMD03_17 [Thiohalocapsa phage LS06-2018-MD03]|nr:hypothetical protein TPMD03_17 [Thiohalocapsa phage LS06-2018-MD03]
MVDINRKVHEISSMSIAEVESYLQKVTLSGADKAIKNRLFNALELRLKQLNTADRVLVDGELTLDEMGVD